MGVFLVEEKGEYGAQRPLLKIYAQKPTKKPKEAENCEAYGMSMQKKLARRQRSIPDLMAVRERVSDAV